MRRREANGAAKTTTWRVQWKNAVGKSCFAGSFLAVFTPSEASKVIKNTVEGEGGGARERRAFGCPVEWAVPIPGSKVQPH